MNDTDQPKSNSILHHRRSIRLKGYDYSQAGAYFVTIVTQGRECRFGEVVDGAMQLSESGRIAEDCWRAIPDHFPDVELGAFVVMPNHVHGIIILNGNRRGTMDGRGTIYRAPTMDTTDRAPTTEQFQKPVAGSLATILRAYKAAVTRRINRELHLTGIWQRNYYEHIIRNENEHDRIHRYIEANPLNWGTDSENLGK